MNLRIAFVALALSATAFAGKTGSGPISPDGKEYATCQLADNLQAENRVGTDGSGLCVFASMRHAGLWQDEKLFAGMLDYMERYPGGGYPRKVDLMLKRASAERGIEIPEYIQIEDNDIEVLKLAVKCRYMPCVRYLQSPAGRYGGQRIDHMVNVAHASDQWFAILDNNFIGQQNLEWMTASEFARIYGGWSIILLTTPTPPQPYNE